MIPKSLCIALTFHMSLFLQFQLPAGCRCPGSAIIAGPHVQMEFNSSPQISLLPQFFFLIKWATVTLILLEKVLEKLGVLPLLPLVSLLSFSGVIFFSAIALSKSSPLSTLPAPHITDSSLNILIQTLNHDQFPKMLFISHRLVAVYFLVLEG